MSDLRATACAIGDELHRDAIAIADWRRTVPTRETYEATVCEAMALALEWAASAHHEQSSMREALMHEAARLRESER